MAKKKKSNIQRVLLAILITIVVIFSVLSLFAGVSAIAVYKTPLYFYESFLLVNSISLLFKIMIIYGFILLLACAIYIIWILAKAVYDTLEKK